MTTVYKAKVRRDGALSMPKAMREKLHLREGDEVEIAVSTPVATQDGGDENWAERFARECDELCQLHGYGDAPTNFAATWKKEKQQRILNQNYEP